MKLDLPDVVDYARGCAFLGTGGGGDPYIGRQLLEQAIEAHGPPEIIGLEAVSDEALVLPVAMMGAPTVMTEKLPAGIESAMVLQALETRLGRRVDALVSAEIGGLNALLPLVAGCQLSLPVIDADGMGRAFPELQMVTFSIYGVSVSPMTMADESGNLVCLEVGSSTEAERFARSIVQSMGGACFIALFPMSGRQVRESAVAGTLTIAHNIGKVIGVARSGAGNPLAALLEYLSSTPYYRNVGVLMNGKIADLRRETRGGFAVGAVRIDALSGGARLEVGFQNEYLIARRDGAVQAVVPDLICILDTESLEPITVEGLKYGQRVTVLGCSAPPVMRRKESLAVVGPDAFGLDVPYVPVEQLLAAPR